MKPTKTVRIRVSFEYDSDSFAREQRIWSKLVQIYGVFPKRLRVERVEKKRGKR